LHATYLRLFAHFLDQQAATSSHNSVGLKMPQDIPFTWSEDENMLYFVLQVRGAKQKSVDVALCDVYVKVNCRPQLFAVDLRYAVDPEHKQTMCKIGGNKITLNLKKKESGLWQDFRAIGSKAELTQRRNLALEAAAQRETDRLKAREDRKWELNKAGEHEQWRLDQENREQIEKWEADEKAKWEEELLSGFDESGKLMDDGDSKQPAPIENDEDCDLPDIEESVPAPRPSEPKIEFNPEKEMPKVCEVTDQEADEIRANKNQSAPAQPAVKAKTDKDAIWSEKDLNRSEKALNQDDEYEEYMPDVRDNPGKIGMRFSVRPRPGVPVRDRGGREPPHPKNMVKSEVPPMLAGDRDRDEEDPVWLKDKADSLMVLGDYQGAYNAYTEALKLGIHPHAFANRAVADLYLGNFEQCVEDCNRALAIIHKKNNPRPGCPAPPCDPQDQIVKTRCEIRLGTAFLWLGAFKKAEDNFQKALDNEEGLEYEERQQVKEDLARVKNAHAALLLKEKADGAARRAQGSEDLVQKELGLALGAYGEAVKADSENAVVFANRCFANLRAGHLEECIEDANVALALLKQWPIARRAPKAPARPARLDPPQLDDPTFVHPDQQKQGEVDWLMKHSGGDTSNLPPLPPEYEWVKDVAEKGNDNAWIAIKKKMSKATQDAIRDSTKALQETLYSRNPRVILEHVKVAKDLNRVGEGPSAKAITQATEYAEKVEAHIKEQEAEREKDEAELQQEIDDYNLEEALDPTRTGVAKSGFVRSNPVECTQRRLFAKVLLRRARAYELLGNLEASISDLRTVRRVEPENREAKHRLTVVETAAVNPQPEPEPAAVSSSATPIGPGDEAGGAVGEAGAAKRASPSAAIKTSTGKDAGGRDEKLAGKKIRDEATDMMADDDEEEEIFDHAATASLLGSAADYMKRNDYQGALQIYGYVRRRCKDWESPLVEIKVLSNTSLCLQKLRGRLPELIKACSEALERIEEVRVEEPDSVPEDVLLNMECAVLSRRGYAYSQQQRQEESNRDLARVRELLGKPA
jgi:tetratricopeptide (TPR) repeat protein